MWCIGHTRFPRIYIGNKRCPNNMLNIFKYDEITEPVMRGQDAFKRKFLIVKYLINNKIYVDIYLQKSALWETEWIVAGNITDTVFPYNSRLTNKQIAFIEQIIYGKVLKLTADIMPYNTKLNNQYIQLLNI